ncbi:MAG: SLC13 family permease, partial [Halieaceae bacterium]
MNAMTYLDPRRTVWPGAITAAFLGLILLSLDYSPEIITTAVIGWLCMIWWIFEPIPIPVTSLLPIAVLPAAGILTVDQVGAAVGSPLIILLMGGFLLSRGMESTGAHHRIALTVVNLVGGDNPRRLVLGFMLLVHLMHLNKKD